MYCKNCGQQIEDNAKWCTSCGASQDVEAVAEKPADKGGFLWGLLGCCIPLVGLILFLVWKDNKPKTAKSAGIGAIVGVVLWIICSVLSYVVGIGAAMMMY